MTVTVLQLSDTHFGPTADQLVSGYHPEGRLSTVIDAWQNSGETADLVVHTGDAADEGGVEAYARLASALEPLEAPVLAISGNHDLADQMIDAFGGAEIAEIGAWRIVGVNSSRPNEVHGTVDVAAVTELLDALDDRPTIVAIHHPPRSRSTNPYFALGHGEELLEALSARPHVRALISGHLHDAFEFVGPNGLMLLGCPSTLMAIGHEGDRFSIGVAAPTGGRVLRLADDGTFTTSLLIA